MENSLSELDFLTAAFPADRNGLLEELQAIRIFCSGILKAAVLGFSKFPELLIEPVEA